MNWWSVTDEIPTATDIALGEVWERARQLKPVLVEASDRRTKEAIVRALVELHRLEHQLKALEGTYRSDLAQDERGRKVLRGALQILRFVHTATQQVNLIGAEIGATRQIREAVEHVTSHDEIPSEDDTVEGVDG